MMYSRVPNCKGGLFSVFSIFCLQYHFIMTPPFYDFLSQVVQFDSISYINLSKIHHLHFIMTPAFSEIFNLCRPPLTNRPPPTIRYTRVFDEICYFTIHLQCYLFQIARKMRARQRYLRDLKRAIHKSGKRSYLLTTTQHLLLIWFRVCDFKCTMSMK